MFNQETPNSLIVRTDCRYYRGSMPCIHHKRVGRLCQDCGDYDRIQHRILIVKLAAMGDVLRTTSILPALLQKYPSAEITWITQSNAADLLRENPRITRLLVVEGNYLEYLTNEIFDIGICLDADPHAATIMSISRCKEKFGFMADTSGKVKPANDAATEWWWMGVNDQRKKLNRKSYQQLMYEICGLPLPTVRPQLYLNNENHQVKQKLLKETTLQGARKIVGINTGGGGRWQFKKWTLEGYIECIRLLKQKFPSIGLLLLGGPEEVSLNQKIIKTVGNLIVDGGCRNPLMEFAAKVASVDVLLTADSLGMHIAVALEKPTVVLVGPTSPWELDVFDQGAIIYSEIECLACYLSRCDKTVNCMNMISPERVVAQLAAFL